MKSIAASLLAAVAIGCEAMAQQPQITAFSSDGTLTWTNADTNVYCGIEFSWNLSETWQGITSDPPFWNLQPTQAVTSVGLSNVVSTWNPSRVAFSNLSILGENAVNGLYFHVVSSPEPLVQPFITNGVHLVNASTSVLSNVIVGLKQSGSYNPLTNFEAVAQSGETPIVHVWQPRSPLGFPPQMAFTNLSTGGALYVQDGWYVSYDQAGSSHDIEMGVIPLGPPEKNFLLTVSNNSVTMEAEWLGRSGTMNY